MSFEFSIPQRVLIVTDCNTPGIVVDRYAEQHMNFYRVAFDRYGSWRIDVYPEISLKAQEFGFIARLKRKIKGPEPDKPTVVNTKIEDFSRLGVDVKLPPPR